MPEVTPDSCHEPFSEDFQLALDNEQPLLELGQTVVVSAGILQGATGTVAKKAAGGHYLVSLGEQKNEIWARLPAHLLRAT
jgi:hypothetical protein